MGAQGGHAWSAVEFAEKTEREKHISQRSDAARTAPQRGPARPDSESEGTYLWLVSSRSLRATVCRLSCTGRWRAGGQKAAAGRRGSEFDFFLWSGAFECGVGAGINSDLLRLLLLGCRLCLSLSLGT